LIEEESPSEEFPTQGEIRPPLYILDNSLDEAKSGIPIKPLSEPQLRNLNERSLAMHLYRSFQNVLACQEALWEELKDRLRNRRQELQPFGWDDDDELEELQSRKRFERLIERYRRSVSLLPVYCAGWVLMPFTLVTCKLESLYGAP
jgi:hypothetical protein